MTKLILGVLIGLMVALGAGWVWGASGKGQLDRARQTAELRADLLAGVPQDLDAVLANLPYVRDGERAALAPEIRLHEPPSALLAGPDGLAAISALLEQLAPRASVRTVALEVGAGQASAVAQMVLAAGFARVRVKRDLAGIERVVVGEDRR